MSVEQRTVTTVYSRSNDSILYVTNMSESLIEQIEPLDLLSAFDFILANATALDVDGENLYASFFRYLWSWFNLDNEEMDDVQATVRLQSLLAQCLLMYQVGAVSGIDIPPSFHVSADFARESQRAIIPKWTVILYTIISGSIYLFAIGSMFIAMFVQGPSTTPFDSLDFASRVVSNPDTTLRNLMSELSNGDIDRDRQRLEDKGLFIGDVKFCNVSAEREGGYGMSKIGFSLSPARLPSLQKGHIYE